MTYENDDSANDLPFGWRWVRLADICREDKRPVKPRDGDASELPYMSLEHVETQSGSVDIDAIFQNSEKVLSNTYEFDINHVLYGKLRPYLNKVVVPDFRGRCTTEIIPLVPIGVTRKYLARILRRPESVQFAMSGKTGSRMPRTDMRALMTMQIPLAPLRIQSKIDDALDVRLGHILNTRQVALEQLQAINALAQTYLRECFPLRGELMPAEWRWVRLKEVCDPVNNINPKREPHQKFRYVEISAIDRVTKMIINPRTITGRTAPSRARRMIQKNDVLVSTTRPHLNAVALVPEELDGHICTTGICVLRSRGDIDPRYLFQFTRTPAFVTGLINDEQGTAYPAVTDGHVFNQLIPLAPKHEQVRIGVMLSERMNKINEMRNAAESEIAMVNALEGVFMREAFAGRLS